MFNEEGSIEQTIRSLYALDYPRDRLTVICVNDGSTDKTLSILKDLQKTYPFRIINQKNQGKYMALNNGLKQVKTPYFACLDADSFVTKGSLKAIIEEFDEPKVGAVMPVMKVHEPENILQRVQWLEYVLNIFYKFIMGKLDCIHVTPGPFSVYRTSVVRKLGGFTKGHLTEDLEMALRLQDHHYKLKQSLRAMVHTVSPRNLKGFIAQRTRWYQGTLLNVKDYRHFLLNRKYGDFGLFHMPLVATTGILTMVGALTGLYLILKEWYFTVKRWWLTNFDFMTYISSFEWNTTWLDFDWQVLFLTGFMFLIIFTLIYLALIGNQERVGVVRSFRYFLAFLYYFIIYQFLLAIIWLHVLRNLIIRKGNKWTKVNT
jgi:cellulose synthase/poly-beta-1,6-N-acetylglucosamine synthase-like glycosyltransferase